MFSLISVYILGPFLLGVPARGPRVAGRSPAAPGTRGEGVRAARDPRRLGEEGQVRPQI